MAFTKLALALILLVSLDHSHAKPFRNSATELLQVNGILCQATPKSWNDRIACVNERMNENAAGPSSHEMESCVSLQSG